MNQLLSIIISFIIGFGIAFGLKGRLDSGQEAKIQLQATRRNYEHQQQAIASDQEIVQKNIDEQAKIKTIYKTIYKEKIKYVKDNPNINDFLASYWMCSMDQAAEPFGMQTVDCQSYAAATTSATRIDTAVAVVQRNYEKCNEMRTNYISLIDLVKKAMQ